MAAWAHSASYLASLGLTSPGTLRSLPESLTPVGAREIDDSAAPTAGNAVGRYKLAKRLQGWRAARLARNRNDNGNTVRHVGPSEENLNRPDRPIRSGLFRPRKIQDRRKSASSPVFRPCGVCGSGVGLA
jgi:hypothetical protein